MPIIPYTASNFGRHWGGTLSGGHNLNLTWNAIVWAAITMGKPGVAFLLAHGWHSVSDLVVRSHTVYANLCGGSKYIEKSSLYADLDPTEKSGVSYFMGMIAAKLLGIRLLDTPWLFHLSMIKALGGSVVLKSQSQPDLIGLRRSRDWIVAEAKGRTGKYSASAMATAKLQTRQVRKINSQYPSLRVAIQASFNPRLQLAIEDPEDFEEDAPDVQFDPEDVLNMYYSAATTATENAERRIIRNRPFLVREIPEIGVTIGLDENVRERLEARSMLQGDSSLLSEQSTEQAHDGDFSIFPDGLALFLDDRWSESRMATDPWMRRNS